MKNEPVICEQTCRNSCAMLVESLRRETAMIQFYEQILAQCVDPEIHAYMQGLVEMRRGTVGGIVDKMNQIRAKSVAMDGVQSSFDA